MIITTAAPRPDHSLLMSDDTVPGRPADARVTYRQLGWVRAELGARDAVTDDKNGLLWFRVGAPRPYRKIIIKLRADDTYAIEIGYLKKHDGLPAFFSQATIGTEPGLGMGVYAEDLADRVRALYSSVVNG